jgi:hypothetical protein
VAGFDSTGDRFNHQKPISVPTFDVFGAVFGVWPETLCREPGEPFTNSEVGSTPATGVAGRASRPASCVCDGHRSFGNFDAPTVFREGAENSTRGRVRSPSTSEFRFSPAFIREDQSAKPPTGAIGRLRSPFFILAFLGS